MDRFSHPPVDVHGFIYKLLTTSSLELAVARRGQFCAMDEYRQSLRFVSILAAKNPRNFATISKLMAVSRATRVSVVNFAVNNIALRLDINADPKPNLEDLNYRLQHPERPLGPHCGSTLLKSISKLEIPFIVAFNSGDDNLWRMYRNKIQITKLNPGMFTKVSCEYLGTNAKEEWEDDMPSPAGRATFKTNVEIVVRDAVNHCGDGGLDEAMIFRLYDGLKKLREMLLEKPRGAYDGSHEGQAMDLVQGSEGIAACVQCGKPKLLEVAYSREICLRCNLL